MKFSKNKMINTCEFHFENNPRRIVYAGELLSGTVKLQVMNPKKVRNMYVCVKGVASTHWEDEFDMKMYLGQRKYLIDKTAGIFFHLIVIWT